MKTLTLRHIVHFSKSLQDDIEAYLRSARGYRHYDIGEARRDLASLRKTFIALTGSARGFPREIQA